MNSVIETDQLVKRYDSASRGPCSMSPIWWCLTSQPTDSTQPGWLKCANCCALAHDRGSKFEDGILGPHHGDDPERDRHADNSDETGRSTDDHCRWCP